MPGATLRQVNFAATPRFSRAARDDERYVMERFAAHASHCRDCNDPYRVHISGRTLCDRGHAYARDVGEYIFSKAGKPFSIIDKHAHDERVQVEIPAGCDVIRDLLQAIDRGLKIRKERPVISHDRSYYVSDRRPHHDDERYDVVEMESRRHRDEDRRRHGEWRSETVYVQGRGSLYRRDEEERRRRRRDEGEPVIIVAAPRRDHRR